MEVCKALWFCLGVLAVNTRQSESLALNASPQDCACFPTDKSSIRISKLADNYGKHERKVVYLFRHLDSQQVTIYIPNEEKQLNFPDLTVNSHESYDLHKMEHLYYIFDNPSNMVTVGHHINSVDTTSTHNEIPHKPKHPGVENVAIPQHPTVIPAVYEIKPDSIGVVNGKPVSVHINNGQYQPSYVHPNTGNIKLPLSLPDHDVNIVTLVPEHGNDQDVQPEPIVNETIRNITDLFLVHGVPISVSINNGKYQPNYVNPDTGNIKLPASLPDHDVNIVTLVPGHGNDQDQQQKPTANETTVDSTDRGNHKLPSTIHEHDVNSVIMDPGHEEIVVNFPNQPQNQILDIINVFPDHDPGREDPQRRPIVNETKVDLPGPHPGQPEHLILDNTENQPTNFHPSNGDNIKDSTQVESEQDINILELHTNTAHPLHGIEEDINVVIVPSNLNKVPNTQGHDTNDIEIISVLPNDGSNIKVVHDSSSGKQTVHPSITTKPHDEDVTLENSIQSQESGYHFIYKFQDLLSEDQDNLLPSSLNVQFLKSPVINEWLVEEMNNIIKSGPGTLSPATINLIEIKKRLLHILAQNGLQFTENGYLIDIHGHILQLTNLKFRRVMISDPVAYKKLLGRHKCVTPYEIPYLEAVFVSMVHPSKVLGLIPLRMTSLPGCRGHKCPGRPCSSRKHRPVIAHHRHPSKLNNAPINNKGLNGRGHYSNYNSVNKPGLLKDLNILLGTRKGDKKDDKTHHDAEDQDGLGIRIIGGNPATGSGTPVSSRGRSDHKESESLYSK